MDSVRLKNIARDIADQCLLLILERDFTSGIDRHTLDKDTLEFYKLLIAYNSVKADGLNKISTSSKYGLGDDGYDNLPF